MSAELHIASFVVHAHPSRIEPVSRFIEAIPGARIHAQSPTGKLVVTLEAETAAEVLAALASLQRAEGVLSAALVYQYADSLAAMMEEVPEGESP